MIPSTVCEMNRNRNQRMIPFTIHLIPIPVPIPPKCAQLTKEPKSQFLRNRNRLSTNIEVHYHIMSERVRKQTWKARMKDSNPFFVINSAINSKSAVSPIHPLDIR